LFAWIDNFGDQRVIVRRFGMVWRMHEAEE
jgi:hypothetical protein